MTSAELPQGLHRRIVGALQVDGRASWRKIAEVLGEPERTVTRYGTELLESRQVIISGMKHEKQMVVLSCDSIASTALLAAESIAKRPDVTFTYLTTGSPNIVAEIGYSDNLGDLLLLELPATPGLQNVVAHPILKFFKTIRGWRSGALNEAEERALTSAVSADHTEWDVNEARGSHDEELMHLLHEDGRASIESIARHTKMTPTSASRRIDYLITSGQYSIRTLVEPSILGFGVEALLWVQTTPDAIETLGQKLAAWPSVRYLAALAGNYQLLVNVTATSHAQLYQMISHPVWNEHQVTIHTTFLAQARKRGGVLLPHHS